MPRLPDGEPVPADGPLTAEALDALGALEAGSATPFGIYLHVPFCRVRCGYCDFNTYAPGDLGEQAGSLPAAFVEAALGELRLAAQALGGRAPRVETVFVGGGTPTLLAPHQLTRLLGQVRESFGLRDTAEVTTEANPDTVDPAMLGELADAGFTRVSVGMQSAVPQVLATLDRTHDPANVARAVAAARGAGLQVSLDLIYGTPGESLDQWRTSLDAAIALAPDHISAYALTVEEGTALAARVRRGELPMPTGDDEADKYELAADLLESAGYHWYEISNFATATGTRSRHNLAYWTGGDWLGIGPGAHSHVGGVRWWNVKHPRAYADRIAANGWPAAAREVLTAEQKVEERLLLGIRLADGLPIEQVPGPGRPAIPGLIADGLIDGADAVRQARIRLTVRGRLLADSVVLALLG